MKTILLVSVGFVMLLLGVIGIIVPILPTTPFVIVAAACFSSTPALHARIMKIPFIREHITNHKTRTGLSRRTVTVSLTFLWVMLIVSAITLRNLWLMPFLAIVGTAVTVHIVIMSKPRKRETEYTATKIVSKPEERQ